MRKILGENGFSLVELLVVSGLIGGMALVVVSIQKQANHALKTITESFEVESLYQEVRTDIIDQSACQSTFDDLPRLLNGITIPGIKRKSGIGEYIIGMKRGDIELEAMRVRNLNTVPATIPTDGEGLASFDVSLTIHKMKSNRPIEKNIPIQAKVKKVGTALKVVNCFTQIGNTLEQACLNMGGTFDVTASPPCLIASSNQECPIGQYSKGIGSDGKIICRQIDYHFFAHHFTNEGTTTLYNRQFCALSEVGTHIQNHDDSKHNCKLQKGGAENSWIIIRDMNDANAVACGVVCFNTTEKEVPL